MGGGYSPSPSTQSPSPDPAPPTGGGSVKDALDRIEQHEEEQGLALTGLGERMTAVEETVSCPRG